MKAKIFTSLAVGFVIGYGVHANLPPSQAEIDKTQATAQTLSELKTHSASLQQALKTTRKKLTKLEEKSGLSAADLALDNEADTMSEQQIDALSNTVAFAENEEVVAAAKAAMTAGDVAEASKLFNLALGKAKTDAERQAAIDGLIEVHRANYDAIMQEGIHLHGALWQLFEIHKLRPEDQVNSDMAQLSQTTLARAKTLLEEGDLLGSSDYLSALMHTSKMAGYEVIDTNGEHYGESVLIEQLADIQSQPAFVEALQQRASHNLNQGNDFERSIVFWDYTKLAELGGQEVWQQQEFTEQFTQAALEHLQHLKDYNQPGEIKSRMDYIRYAFPAVMKDERIYNFH